MAEKTVGIWIEIQEIGISGREESSVRSWEKVREKEERETEKSKSDRKAAGGKKTKSAK